MILVSNFIYFQNLVGMEKNIKRAIETLQITSIKATFPGLA